MTKKKKPLKFSYSNHESLSKNICIYCGEHGTSLDHIPALTILNLYPDIEKIVVRACLNCNILLSNRPYNSIKERTEFLYYRYPQTYKKILDQPVWSKQELRDLKGSLRLIILQDLKKKKVIERKLEHLQELLLSFQ